MTLLGPEKFDNDHDYTEYLDAVDVPNDSWRRNINALCASDYGAVPDAVPTLVEGVRVCSAEESKQIDDAIFASTGIPSVAQRRKAQPVWLGFDVYFPDAIIKVAELSLIAQEQHHPGTPLHWDKTKSSDHYDALRRHMLDVAKGIPIDDDKVWHRTKVAWRAMAELQEECERQECDRVAATKDT